MPTVARRPNRFHGRVAHQDGRRCNMAGCSEAGEFRAPKSANPDVDGYFWYCLDHVRAYNADWNYFNNLSAEDAARARYDGGWTGPTWPFSVGASGGVDGQIDDPLGVFRDHPRFRNFAADIGCAPGGKRWTARDRAALATLGLDEKAGVADIRRRYKEMLKRYHPDANGGNRAFEVKLRKVIEAYQRLADAEAGGARKTGKGSKSA